MPDLGPGDRAQIEGVSQALSEVLGGEIEGAYLYGSATLGGLRRRSDLDVLAVIGRRTTTQERVGLIERVLPISGSDPAASPPRPVELTLVVASEIRPWRYPPSMDLQYGEWWRDEFEQGITTPWRTRTDPDVTLLLEMARRAGVTLVGRPARSIIPTISSTDLRSAMLDCVDGLLLDVLDTGSDTDTTNLLLTLARIWHGLELDAPPIPKDAAATWAIARLDDDLAVPLRHARAVYLGEEAERWPAHRGPVELLVDEVVREIRSSA